MHHPAHYIRAALISLKPPYTSRVYPRVGAAPPARDSITVVSLKFTGLASSPATLERGHMIVEFRFLGPSSLAQSVGKLR